MSCRPLPLAALSALVALPALAGAQPVRKTTTTTKSTTTTATTERRMTGAETGAFVVQLGADTLAVERYTRTGNRIEGSIANRSPVARVTSYVVTLDAAGRPERIEYNTRRPDGTMLPNGATSVALTFRNDSVYREVKFADSTSTGAAAAPAGTVASIANSFAMYEIGLRPLRAAKQGAGSLSFYGPGAPRAQPIAVAFPGGDTARVEYFGDPLYVMLDGSGRIVGVDGSRTTNKVMVRRLPTADVAAAAAAFGAGPAMGQTSPRDSIAVAVGPAQLSLQYGRPSRRGRTVWGGTLVPYDAIWRTGANQATHFQTSTDLVIGGVPVPAGTYTLFTWPTAGGYQLVINKQTGQWGTEYKQEMDLARVPLTATTLPTPVEQFTFAIEPAGAGGTLKMSWDTLQLAVPFTVKQ
jgi:hypothetical protein